MAHRLLISITMRTLSRKFPGVIVRLRANVATECEPADALNSQRKAFVNWKVRVDLRGGQHQHCRDGIEWFRGKSHIDSFPLLGNL
jgi:hypothetical protein